MTITEWGARDRATNKDRSPYPQKTYSFTWSL